MDDFFDGFNDALTYINNTAKIQDDTDDQTRGLAILLGAAPKLSTEETNKVKTACKAILNMPLPAGKTHEYIEGRKAAVEQALSDMADIGS